MQHVRAVVASEFEQVNQLIVEQLHSDVAMVENIGHYIIDAGGKRLRPLLVLLAAKACNYQGGQHIPLAAVIEFIHTATLLHDDVVDISSLRRGRATANAEFGNAPSVLVGDFLYSRAFQMLVDIGDMTIMRCIADTTNTVAEGEVLQLVRAGDATTSEQQYLDVIRRKTAILFAAACYGGAALAGCDEPTCTALHRYGESLGIAFQMIDDVLDYEGDPDTMGKNLGDDLTEGKPTLPLIYALQHGTASERALIHAAITEKSAENLSAVAAAVQRCGALDYTRDRAIAYQQQALASLESLSVSNAREALARIAEIAVQRDH
ncbi:MAG: octaprenyl diphosphate synthase [Gammaproteobacteria bacterium]|nr:MAG: octaprenyl diphosphate synthase [Gammaproteobacteria bacterium]